MSELRSALIVAAPEAGDTVERWRERTCSDRPSIGIPAHVTILFPFVPARAIDNGLVDELGALFAQFEPFRFELRKTRRFPEVLYLAPEPPAPFVELIEAVGDAYPDYPPYDGEVPRNSIVPHLTVAYGNESLLADAEAEITPLLPNGAEAREVLLMEEVEPDWGALANAGVDRSVAVRPDS